MSKNRWKLVVVLVVGLALFSIVYNDAYAQESEDTKWTLVYLKGTDCKSIDSQIVNEYAGIVSKYLQEYQFTNVKNDSLCMKISDFENKKSQINSDLVVLVYDPIVGSQLLGSKYLDGMYIHQGSDRSTNHLILLCDCYTSTSGFETPLPSWVLSHELSHFVLSYKGYTHYAIQKIVHTMDERYNSCIATNNANCDEIKIKIHPDDSSKDFVVMKPYAPAVGNQLTKYLTDDLVNSKLISMQKQYTKLWVSGTIDDDTYITSIKNWIDSPSDLNSETDTPYMFIPNGFVIADISKSSPDNWHDPKKQYFMETKKMLLDNIPIMTQFEEESQDDIPNWFKTRARLWSQDRISNDVFFNGIENLIRNDVISVK